MHGRLHERDGRRVDYSVVKCYLFHVFEHPEQHNERSRRPLRGNCCTVRLQNA